MAASGDRPSPSKLLRQLTQWRSEAIALACLQNIEPREVDLLLDRIAKWSARDRLLGCSPERVNWEQLEDFWQRRWRERVPLHYLLGV
ncbi:MAG: hypothetical protein AAFX40_00965, partial [Cyanobacteria bacterium J06639_1]